MINVNKSKALGLSLWVAEDRLKEMSFEIPSEKTLKFGMNEQM